MRKKAVAFRTVKTARKRGLIALLAIVGLVLSSFKGTEAEVGFVPPDAPPYSLDQYAPYAGAGPIVTKGRMVVLNMGPYGTSPWAGVKVYAVPALPYSIWYVKRMAYCFEITSNCKDTGVRYPAELRNDDRVTYSDSQGYFQFNDLHPQHYIFYAKVGAMILSSHTAYTPETNMGFDGEPETHYTPHQEGDGQNDSYIVGAQMLVKPGAIVPNFVVLSHLQTS